MRMSFFGLGANILIGAENVHIIVRRNHMSSMANARQVIVIGGGPGGYVAAIKASQAGRKVTLIERNRVGGTCLNVGCIATKCLLNAAHCFASCDSMSRYGVTVDDAAFSIQRAVKYKNTVVDKLVGGVAYLLAKNGVEIINGTAGFLNDETLAVNGEEFGFEHLIIAAGSDAARPPIPGLEASGALYSHDALSIDHVPERITIIGGGVVSMELAEFFSSVGSAVTVIEMMPELLPAMDGELGAAAGRIMRNKGVAVFTGASVTGIERGRVTFEKDGAISTVASSDILVAVGRVPNLKSLRLENTSIGFSKSGITVDDFLRTSVPNIYAVGDAIPTSQLAAVASDEGAVAAANIAGGNRRMDYGRVPSCVFTQPQIATVGMSEEAAREKGIDYRVGKFPMSASGRAMVENVSEGFVKIIAKAGTEQVLGLHIVAPDATELISLGSLAIGMEATLEELIENYYPHPTVGEAVMEAALAARGKAVHV